MTNATKSSVELKAVLLGDKGVGKTSLVLRFIEGHFTPSQPSTIGAFFLTKKFTTTAGVNVKMQIWDTAGQERFRAMAPMYYRNAAAAIVCFDITDEQSFEMMKDWVNELKRNVPEDKQMIAIAGTKADLASQRVVSALRAKEYAQSINALLIETSAKDNVGVADLFQQVAEKAVETRWDSLVAGSGRDSLRIAAAPPARKKACC